jgi:hypothetical protein
MVRKSHSVALGRKLRKMQPIDFESMSDGFRRLNSGQPAFKDFLSSLNQIREAARAEGLQKHER